LTCALSEDDGASDFGLRVFGSEQAERLAHVSVKSDWIKFTHEGLESCQLVFHVGEVDCNVLTLLSQKVGEVLFESLSMGRLGINDDLLGLLDYSLSYTRLYLA
jgi:hypothetical protein